MLPPFFVYLVVDPAVVGVRVRSPELWPRTPAKSWLSVRRVHVINSTQLEVYCRDLRGSFYPQTAGDDWVVGWNVFPVVGDSSGATRS
jgi:hypothetical protein